MYIYGIQHLYKYPFIRIVISDKTCNIDFSARGFNKSIGLSQRCFDSFTLFQQTSQSTKITPVYVVTNSYNE